MAGRSSAYVVPGQTTQTRNYDYTVDATKCRLTQQIIEPSSTTLKVTTNLGFDSCGNVNSVQVTGSTPAGAAMSARTIDDVTGEVIHVGGPGFRYGPGSGDVP